MTVSSFQDVIFIISMVILSLSIIAIFLRAIVGPRVTDRIICINMIGTKIIIFICVLAGILREDFLIDVALVYALINFISIVVLTYAYGHTQQKKAITKVKNNVNRLVRGGRA